MFALTFRNQKYLAWSAWVWESTFIFYRTSVGSSVYIFQDTDVFILPFIKHRLSHWKLNTLISVTKS